MAATLSTPAAPTHTDSSELIYFPGDVVSVSRFQGVSWKVMLSGHRPAEQGRQWVEELNSSDEFPSVIEARISEMALVA